MPAPIRLRLFENYRFVLYAPFYAARTRPAPTAAEGSGVELLPSPGRRPRGGGRARGRGRCDVDGPHPHHEGARTGSRLPTDRLCRGGLPRPVLARRRQAEPRASSLADLGAYPVRLGQRGADRGPLAVPRPRTSARPDSTPIGSTASPIGMADNIAALHAGTLPVSAGCIQSHLLKRPCAAASLHIWQQSSSPRPAPSYTVFATHRDPPRGQSGAVSPDGAGDRPKRRKWVAAQLGGRIGCGDRGVFSEP